MSTFPPSPWASMGKVRLRSATPRAIVKGVCPIALFLAASNEIDELIEGRLAQPLSCGCMDCVAEGRERRRGRRFAYSADPGVVFEGAHMDRGALIQPHA